MDLGLQEQVVVVTGGGRGIGAATARMFAQEGAKLVIWDRDMESAGALAREIETKGGETLPVVGDVGSSDDVKKVVDQIIKRFGTVHVLVNNAGFVHIAPVIEMTDAQWSDVINVHMAGAFNCTRAIAPAMIAQSYGRIINISSLSVLGADRMAPYAAAKAGLVGLTRALAVELGPHNVTVNAIAPGFIRTDRVKASPAFPVLNAHSQRAQMIKAEGTPEDVANGILFYASRKSGFVTGDLMYITGGMYQLW
jgi:3-oxoacyl-[acyl-carrier protein] reductase